MWVILVCSCSNLQEMICLKSVKSSFPTSHLQDQKSFDIFRNVKEKQQFDTIFLPGWFNTCHTMFLFPNGHAHTEKKVKTTTKSSWPGLTQKCASSSIRQDETLTWHKNCLCTLKSWTKHKLTSEKSTGVCMCTKQTNNSHSDTFEILPHH